MNRRVLSSLDVFAFFRHDGSPFILFWPVRKVELLNGLVELIMLTVFSQDFPCVVLSEIILDCCRLCPMVAFLRHLIF